MKKLMKLVAIAGLSMGGRISLNVGFHLPDQVGYIGAFSPAYGIFPYTNMGLTENGLFTEETYTTTGGHDWVVWKHGFYNFARYAFQPPEAWK